MSHLIKGLAVGSAFLLLWYIGIVVWKVPAYILPTPTDVLSSLIRDRNVIAAHALPTSLEILLGLFSGITLGITLALGMSLFRFIRFCLLPILLISQAIPMFAIAPLIIIWLGYGVAAKVMISMLILCFPIANSFFDDLEHSAVPWIELARLMNARPWNLLWQIRVPAALPGLASGIRLATAMAPMTAIVSEWVGSSQGLGFLLLSAQARLQIDLVFSVIVVLSLLSLFFYFSIDILLRWVIFWSYTSHSIEI